MAEKLGMKQSEQEEQGENLRRDRMVEQVIASERRKGTEGPAPKCGKAGVAGNRPGPGAGDQGTAKLDRKDSDDFK